MNCVHLALFFFFCWLLPLGCFAVEKPFVVIIPSYNNRLWFTMNLDSVFQQNYQNYRVIYIDDHSPDGTADYVKDYVKERQQEHRFTLIKNREKRGSLACLQRAMGLCAQDEIIVDLDGNDWFAHDNVLPVLNDIYSDPDVWMTYGQSVLYPSYSKAAAVEIPQVVIEERSFRSYEGRVGPLRTFYAGLFQEIAKTDFLYEGNFIRKGGELAYLFPMLEMAGKHSRFISEVLYVYNRAFPLNDYKALDPSANEIERFLRQKEQYGLLECFPDHEPPFYAQIEDICHPTLEDYFLIQDFLANGERKNIDRLGSLEGKARQLVLAGNTPETFPKLELLPVNCSPEDRENCILLFVPFNGDYLEDLNTLLKFIQAVDYQGHILYRLGGWPDLEAGSLKLAHVPFAFKPCLLKEAQSYGFKRVLWLHPSTVPLMKMDKIFQEIEEKGHFIIGSDQTLASYLTPETAAFFGLGLQQAGQIPSCFPEIFGFDLTNETNRKIIDFWYRAALDQDAYFSSRPDQNILSILLNEVGISDFISRQRVPDSFEKMESDSFFFLDANCTSDMNY